MRAPELPKKIGRYEIVRELGTGSMGRVMLGQDPVLERDVAVKVLRADLRIPSDVREGLVVRMRHEARAAARVTHPNLVILHDMGEDAGFGLFLVFEYLDGPTLKSRIAEKRLSPIIASKLAREIGGALTFAHAKGVLHRDVKPENIILTEVGAKLADFGIARVPDSTLTKGGGVLGTPAYSAPETFHDAKFSPESDQFSLASTLYEAISGARAFPGDDAVSVATKIANDTPKPFAVRLSYDPSLDDVLARGMAKDPTARYPTCGAFSEALALALEARGRGASSHSATGGEPAARSLPREERRPWQVLVGGLGLVIVAALLVRAFLKNHEASLVDSAAPSASAEPPPSASAKKPHPIATHVPEPTRTVAPAMSSSPSAGSAAPMPSSVPSVPLP